MKPKNMTDVPTNITELRDDLLNMYAEITSGMINLPMAKEKANTAGKIIKSAAVQLEYAMACKTKPSIPFLEGTPTRRFVPDDD